jgi:nicotinamide riboside kinase
MYLSLAPLLAFITTDLWNTQRYATLFIAKQHTYSNIEEHPHIHRCIVLNTSSSFLHYGQEQEPQQEQAEKYQVEIKR